MSSPNKKQRYDKYTYAVKRKNENETTSPTGNRTFQNVAASPPGLQALIINRDGFAIAEDNSLMSRFVSPPRFLHAPHPDHPAIVYSTLVPTVAPPSATTQVPTPTSGNTSIMPGCADPWSAFVDVCQGQLCESDIILLEWDTVSSLLQHYKFTNPVDIAKIQLAYKKLRAQLVDDEGNLKDGVDFPSAIVSPSRTIGGASTNAGGDRSVLVRVAPSNGVQSVQYGRPSSPRRGGRFVPDHKKPLHWHAETKLDTGRGKK